MLSQASRFVDRYCSFADSALAWAKRQSTNVLGENDILSIVHAAAVKLPISSGYSDIIHLFLPRGVDTCFDLSAACYSPDNPSSFAFCAYHGSVVFGDIGRILFTVEPYQDVPGCQSATPTPNGDLVDSTASILSHETFETITDPDIDAWFSYVSLAEADTEIGDICEPIGNTAGQFLDPVIEINQHKYKIQLEYSNKFHARRPPRPLLGGKSHARKDAAEEYPRSCSQFEKGN